MRMPKDCLSNLQQFFWSIQNEQVLSTDNIHLLYPILLLYYLLSTKLKCHLLVDTLHKKLHVHVLEEFYRLNVSTNPIVLLFNQLRMKPKIFHLDGTQYNLHSLYGSSSWFPILLIRSPISLLIHLHSKKLQLDILDVFKLLLFSACALIMYIFQVISVIHPLLHLIHYSLLPVFN